MLELNIIFIEFDNNFFIDIKENIIIALYIDNLLFIDYNKIIIQAIKAVLNVIFYISNLKLYVNYLDIIIKRNYYIDIIYLN